MKGVFDNILEEREVKRLSNATSRVFEIIHSRWPINPLEVADLLDDEGSVKSLSAKYVYHFKKLNKKGLIRMKKIGNTYVAWPADIEKLRLIHELLRGA